MTLHYLQHVPFEGLGSIEDWAVANSHAITCTRLYAADPLPPACDFDLLVVMGGPMGVHDVDRHPWLTAEKDFIRDAVDADRVIIGICLGAQLLADVLGASVTKNTHKEIGWFPLTPDPGIQGTEWESLFAEDLEAFHWHGDTFDIPQGALRLASSKACLNQGFVYAERLVAMQFHLETTPGSAAALIENCGDELVDGPFIQQPAQMLSQAERFPRINRVMDRLLDELSDR
jgi:GMP synthase (glutamine-hydrolysing)